MVGKRSATMKRTPSQRSRPTFTLSRRNSGTTCPGSPEDNSSDEALSATSSSTSNSSLGPTIHDLFALSLARHDQSATAGKRPRRRAYDAYDRFGAIVSVPLTTCRTAQEALDESDLLGGGDEWEDEEDTTATTPAAGQQAEPLPFELQAFVAEASQHVGPITGMAYFARGAYHQVYVVQTDSRMYAARFDVNKGDAAARRRLEREVATMRLARDAGVPVPEVIASDSQGSDTQVGAAWMLMEWCEGVDRPYAYLTERDDKEMHIRWLAKTMVAIFEAQLSEQRIGSVASYDGETCTIAPSDNLIAAPCQQDADHPDSLQTYLEWLCERANGTTAGTDFCALSRHESTQLVARFRRLCTLALDALGHSLTKDEIEGLHRIALVHGDPDRNVLARAGSPVVAACIDWEFGLCVPAVLAATYPTIISHEGIRNERHHVAECELVRGMVWDESPAKAARMRRVFDSAVAELSPGYYLALQRGRKLRDIVDWLVNWEHDDAFRACAAAFADDMERESGLKLKSSLSSRSLGSLSALSR